MGFNSSFNKNYLSNVPYLDGANSTNYQDDLNDILNNDISASNIYSNTSNLNNVFHSYLTNRTSSNLGDKLLDKQLLTAYKSNNEMIKQLTQHKIEKYKQLKNIETHLDNTPGNNELITQILNGNSGQNIIGEIEVTQNKIDDINNEISIKKRHLEINNYYEKKYSKQQSVLKNVVILLCIILGISFIFKSGLIGEKIFVSLIGILLAFSVIYICYEVYDIFMRDNHKFDEYTYYTRNSPSVGISENEKDKVDIPLELRADIPKFCKLKDKYLKEQQM